MISSIVFVLLLLFAVLMFVRSMRHIVQNIRMGRPASFDGRRWQRWKLMARVAIGQSKMGSRPVSAILHLAVYIGFIVVNIEMLEILIDGIFGTHRVLAFLGGAYPVLISVFELFALAVIVACVVFLIRRNVIKTARFHDKEMTAWPRADANIILVTEILLMSSILIMNAADSLLGIRGAHEYAFAGTFIVSAPLQQLLAGFSDSQLLFIERFCWWFHIIGVFAFLNYIPYSKHLHVFFSFPNVYFSKLGALGKMANMPSITQEIRMMLNPTGEAPTTGGAEEMGQFGAKDAPDFSWKNLLEAYACTECGRCTSSCPAHITGKKLSPRKLVMDLRDRIEELGRLRHKQGEGGSTDGRSLLEAISPEEIWACTTCNACAHECPVNIDPLAIILELRRYLVMEKAAAPGELNNMFSYMENNGAPWQFSREDRLLWTK